MSPTAPQAANLGTSQQAKLPSIVWATGWVSLLTDLSTELVYGILPAFYSTTLRLSVVWMGLIEGTAETVVCFSRLFSGHWSDRTGRRKWWMVAGYGLSAAAKPLLGSATGGPTAMAVRAADRLGKGIRSAPRDALLSRLIASDQRGRAFGVQRAMDHAGALLGGLVAAGLLWWRVVSIADLFWLALLPGGAAVLVIILFVRESASGGDAAGQNAAAAGPGWSLVAGWRGQRRPVRRFLTVLAIFTLGNSSDMLLLKLAFDRFQAADWTDGAASGSLPLLWALLHVVKAATVPWGGRLSDRIGRVAALRGGWLVYALAYAGFALWSSPLAPWVLFAVYGVHFGLVEGPERALIADLTPDADRRGLAYGMFHFVSGLCALPASLLCAGLWQWSGPGLAFVVGAGLALLAAVLLPWALRDPASA